MPPNTTSLIQPLDQGIIRSFKSQYRKRLVSKQILHLECGLPPQDFSKKIDLLEALNMIKLSWNSVTAECILNCFKKGGFSLNEVLETNQDMTIVDDEFALDMGELINIDENGPRCESLTDDGIVEYITLSTKENNDEDCPENNAIEEDISPKPTLREAFAAMNVLTDYFRDNPEARQKIHDLGNVMCQLNIKPLIQKNIQDYFQCN